MSQSLNSNKPFDFGAESESGVHEFLTGFHRSWIGPPKSILREFVAEVALSECYC